MPVLSVRHFQKFRPRSTFTVPDPNSLRWFPGHMASGMKKMQSKLKSVDCVVEVHDARIPFSGRNPLFRRQILGVKPHILVLNKADLADSTLSSRVVETLNNDEGITDVLYTNCRQQSSQGIKEMIPVLSKRISESNRFNRALNREYGVLIIGVPNVGKSSLINSIRSTYLKKPGVARVGAVAGITRAVQNRIKVSNSPAVFVYDTPGILTPNIPNMEVGMKLALCSTLKDTQIGFLTMADYLLYWCNKHGWFNYMDFFGIQEPCNDIHLLLLQYAIKEELYENQRSVDGAGMIQKPAIHAAAQRFIMAFRMGTFGSVLLDKDVLPFKKLQFRVS